MDACSSSSVVLSFLREVSPLSSDLMISPIALSESSNLVKYLLTGLKILPKGPVFMKSIAEGSRSFISIVRSSSPLATSALAPPKLPSSPTLVFNSSFLVAESLTRSAPNVSIAVVSSFLSSKEFRSTVRKASAFLPATSAIASFLSGSGANSAFTCSLIAASSGISNENPILSSLYFM